MGKAMRNRWLGKRERSILAVTFGVFLLIIIPLVVSTTRRDAQASEVRRMRALFLAVSAYEQDHNGAPAPNLLSARRYVFDDTFFQSKSDPYLSGSGFPADAGTPTSPPTSPVRISDTYLWAQMLGKPNAPRTTTDPRYGLIANEWQGQISTEGNFQATVGGRTFRIMMDGSFQTVDLPNRKLGDVTHLFLPKR
jgi:hypothetical protein